MGLYMTEYTQCAWGLARVLTGVMYTPDGCHPYGVITGLYAMGWGKNPLPRQRVHSAG